MHIKILWGFVGDAVALGTDSTKIKRGQEFKEADDEYAHTLIGKGLAVELDASGKPRAKPKQARSAAPSETKPASAPAGTAPVTTPEGGTGPVPGEAT
jgi:hypothetical protein